MVDLLSRVVLPSVVRDLPDDPLQQTSVITHARGLLELDRASDAVTVLDALSGAVEKPSDMFVLLAEAHLKLGQRRSPSAPPGRASSCTNPRLLDLLLAAQRAQGLVSDAVATARLRLAATRDAASLSSAAERLVDTPTASPRRGCPRRLRTSTRRSPFSRRHGNARLSIPLETPARACPRGARPVGGGAHRPRGNHGRARPAPGARVRRASCKCLLSLREYAACLAQCNRSLAVFPDSVTLARHRALAFAEGFVLGVETDGRRVVDDAAMSFFEKIIADATSCEPVDFVTLARYREWTGRADDGVALLAERASAFPESWEIAIADARHLERRGDFEEALAAAQDTARLAPLRPEGWGALAAIRGILGPKEEANEARRKAGQAERRLRTLRAPPPEAKKKA